MAEAYATDRLNATLVGQWPKVTKSFITTLQPIFVVVQGMKLNLESEKDEENLWQSRRRRRMLGAVFYCHPLPQN